MRRIVFAVTVLLLWGATAGANLPDRAFYTGLYGGWHITDDWRLGAIDGTNFLESSPVFGLRVGGSFYKWFGAELDLGYLHAETVRGESASILNTSASALLQAASERVGVVALFGGGVYTGLGGPSDGGVLGYGHVGIGTRIQAIEFMAVRLGGRYLFSPDGHNIELTAGLEFAIWRTPSEPPEPEPKPEPVSMVTRPTVVIPPVVIEKFTGVIEGITFEYDSATIHSDSAPTLKEAAELMQQYPTLRVEIQGHTDNEGTDEYNFALAQRRARAVKAYLVRLGIEESRIRATGYGEAQPRASNDTEEGRALNRRIEFQVFGD